MADSELKWYAVWARSRHEKIVAEELWRKQIEVFLPLYEKVSQWADRKKLIQWPLFPGYLFVHVPLRERRLDIITTQGVVKIVGLNGTPVDIPDQQIEAVKRFVFSTLPIDPYPYIGVGDRVRITRGPLRDLEGILIQKKNKYRFVLSVNLIMQAASCEIDACDVEKIS